MSNHKLSFVWNPQSKELSPKNSLSISTTINSTLESQTRRVHPEVLKVIDLISASLMAVKFFSIFVLVLSYLEPNLAFLQLTFPTEFNLFKSILIKKIAF